MTTQRHAILIAVDPTGTGECHATRFVVETYKDIQRAVGGLMEAVPSDESLTIWINEEGKIHGLMPNALARTIWEQVDTYNCLDHGEWIAGNALIMGGTDDEGETLSCPEWVYEQLGVTEPANAR
jgi:hypothetical protein